MTKCFNYEVAAVYKHDLLLRVCVHAWCMCVCVCLIAWSVVDMACMY